MKKVSLTIATPFILVIGFLLTVVLFAVYLASFGYFVIGMFRLVARFGLEGALDYTLVILSGFISIAPLFLRRFRSGWKGYFEEFKRNL